MTSIIDKNLDFPCKGVGASTNINFCIENLSNFVSHRTLGNQMVLKVDDHKIYPTVCNHLEPWMGGVKLVCHIRVAPIIHVAIPPFKKSESVVVLTVLIWCVGQEQLSMLWQVHVMEPVQH